METLICCCVLVVTCEPSCGGHPGGIPNLGKRDGPCGMWEARAPYTSLCGPSIFAHVDGVPVPGMLQMETLRPREEK